MADEGNVLLYEADIKQPKPKASKRQMLGTSNIGIADVLSDIRKLTFGQLQTDTIKITHS